MDLATVRRMWIVTEPLHALVYFAPETREHYAAAGLKGYWMGYFASRAAAMGPVPAAVVTATFFGFAPRRVQRAIPDAWAFCRPEAVLAARQQAADEALRRLLGGAADGEEVREAADLLRRAAGHAGTAGRPLAAAHAALPWPDPPHLVLWHAATVLREHRGDGHVAALLTAGLDGVTAHLLRTAVAGIDAEPVRERRGWEPDEWAAGAARLSDRGLLDATGAATDDGRALHAALEQRTDELAAGPWHALGEDACARLDGLLTPHARRVAESGEIPQPNPIGLPRA